MGFSLRSPEIPQMREGVYTDLILKHSFSTIYLKLH